MRNKLILDFVSKNYDSNYCEIVSLILRNSLHSLQESHEATLHCKWINYLQKEEERQTFKHLNILDFNNTSPVENRYSIGKQTNNNQKEQYLLPFAMEKCDMDISCNERLDEYLAVLSDGNSLLNELNDILPILIIGGVDKYYVNISGIIDYIQLLDVQKLVHSRFDTLEIENNENKNENEEGMQSNDALRLFGAIISMRKIGDKQLSEICMIKHSTVKKVLYRML
eukprot:UN12758